MTHDDDDPAVRIEWVDANEPPPDLDLRSADEWRILLQLDGTACAAVRLPSPGGGTGPAFLTAALLRHADGLRAHRRFIGDFRRRLGASPGREYRAPSCSVVICTRRRPAFLAGVLAALRDLDPQPFEVIVVDNDPGDEDVRALAERRGARYVREDRRGVNNARAAGVRAARGDVVAFIDDDCVPTRGWLRQLPELFDDPLVAAVTGPAFPFTLATAAQRRRDAVAGFVFGLTRVTYDWTSLRPVHAGQVGAGANMMFRRESFEALPDIFPPDLDTGTPALGGGDLYAFYRVLAAGYRITYDPSSFVFHRHPADRAALYSTIHGYGTGSAAYLTKVLVEEGELAAFAIWRWLPQQYIQAVVARAAGREDALSVRLRWDYLRSSFRGPKAWFEARAQARGLAPAEAAATTAEPAPTGAERVAGGSADLGDVSVVVFGADAELVRRRAAELACDGRFEVVAAAGSSAAAQRNDGAQRAHGDVLVFLDAELVPEPGFVEAHRERLRAPGAPDVVLGETRPHPGRGLIAMYQALWWQQHYAAKRDAVAFTFADVTATNMSVTRAAFDRIGAFDEELLAYDDWDWGARALRGGLKPAFESGAAARRVATDVPLATSIAQAEAEGRAEVALMRRYGVGLARGVPRLRDQSAFGVVDRLGQGSSIALLRLLERVHARQTWLRLYRLVVAAARERGWRLTAGRTLVPAAPAIDIELDDDTPIPAPQLAVPSLRLTRGGEAVAQLAPRRAQWHGGLADEVTRRLARSWWAEADLRWWTSLPVSTRQGLPPEAGDPRGMHVVFGPGSAVARDELRAAGVTVRELSAAEHFWAGADREIRDAGGAAVAVPLPGVKAGPAWLRAVAPGLEGDRIAAIVGAGLHAGDPPAPLVVHSHHSLRERYPTSAGRPSQFIVVRGDLYERLGGFDVALARFGDHAVVLDFLERALREHYAIGYRETPGLSPAGAYRPARSLLEWRRFAAAGALLALAARRTPGAGGYVQLTARFFDEFWSMLVGGKGRRWWLGTRAALLTGCLRGLRN